jgi:hypothetical protein
MSSRNTTSIGQEFCVRDCYVWSEIHYLDSATDYREYLPQNGTHARIRSDDLILLVVLLILGCALLYEML